ncbi:DUF2794 domain-containing protein [Amorphus orientalis]|uniref:DUF2794 domain-containing protein n=1 Tax=Amorphus orientalis TaxID=649198 RepID=A0AAE3VRJ8_9HYPH|nr:DUF2794 domain-containing protein [Amorphus orientalis]MDQ0317044.1 hypothetical protein [Amorphus orientalis]
MSDTEESRSQAGVVPFAPSTPSKSAHRLTSFHRDELGIILRVYGRKVAEGEWRDYAIDHGRDEATFSIFRRTAEVPLYRITKTPANARKQGAYAVVNAGNVVLKRGHDLAKVLRVFEKKRDLRLVGT